jgi:hypothetical protein
MALDDGQIYWGAAWLTIVGFGGPFTFRGKPKDFAALNAEWDAVVEACERDKIDQLLMQEMAAHAAKLRKGGVTQAMGKVRASCPFVLDGSRLALTKGD